MTATSQRQYTKKVVITDDLAAPNARAERLRQLRNMANLSRQQMCEGKGLNINTYKGWEIGRYGGLPIDGAEQVIQYLATKNVISSTEWLLYGKGQAPYALPTSQPHDGAKNTVADNIVKEIMLFQRLHPNSLYVEIRDDTLSPTLQPGDFVAGIRHVGEDIKTLYGQNCIVQTKSGKILVRCLREGQEPGLFNLSSTNPNTTTTAPGLFNVELVFAAPVVRWYRMKISS